MRSAALLMAAALVGGGCLGSDYEEDAAAQEPLVSLNHLFRWSTTLPNGPIPLRATFHSAPQSCDGTHIDRVYIDDSWIELEFSDGSWSKGAFVATAIPASVNGALVIETDFARSHESWARPQQRWAFQLWQGERGREMLSLTPVETSKPVCRALLERGKVEAKFRLQVLESSSAAVPESTRVRISTGAGEVLGFPSITTGLSLPGWYWFGTLPQGGYDVHVEHAKGSWDSPVWIDAAGIQPQMLTLPW